MTTKAVAGFGALLVFALATVTSAAVHTVINTAPSGPGSFEAAVVAHGPGDTVAFAIPGAGPHVITRHTWLNIVGPILIDGYSQPGASPNTLATGNNAVLKIVYTSDTSTIGFIVSGDSCTIRGLVIGGWNIGVLVNGGEGSALEGNYIGIDASGAIDFGNGAGISMDGGTGRIGGTLPSQRNLISGNDVGILIIGPAICHVEGNYLGTNRHGTAGVGNLFGISFAGGSGTAIGDTVSGAGNLISGNIYGIALSTPTSNVRIQGNLIGTDATGLVALGNTDRGIQIGNCRDNLIGGPIPAARNVIAANTSMDIALVGDSCRGNWIAGNYIGTDRTGLASLGANSWGINLEQADSNLIGGGPGLGNVIVGHDRNAIRLADGSDANEVSSNYIGVGPDGTTPVVHGGSVTIDGTSRFNMIGGLDPARGNIIANGTTWAGVRVLTSGSRWNSILSNSIHDFAGQAIDLGDDGLTDNDTLDADMGPNDRMNFPVLTSATQLDTGVLVQGVMMGAPGESCLIQLFRSATCDPLGHGVDDGLLDTFTVLTDGVFGLAPFTLFVDSVLDLGTGLAATATNGSGSTSEYSRCIIVEPRLFDTLHIYLFSPVSMVVTDPAGDSIGIDSASGIIFNTMINSSSYDTTSDVNSPLLTGPDGSDDDVVTMPRPLPGPYRIRLFVSDLTGSSNFSLGVRIGENQMYLPKDYRNQPITALGNTIDPVYLWKAATTMPGDVNANGLWTAADIILLVNYVFKSGRGPVVPGHGDVDCSGAVTSADIIYMVNCVLKSGLSPCSQSAG